MKNELLSGEYKIYSSDINSYSEEIIAKVSLSITYCLKTKDDTNKSISDEYITISTDDAGGGNYFKITTFFDPDENEDVNSFKITDFYLIEPIIKDFKSRYEQLIKNHL